HVTPKVTPMSPNQLTIREGSDLDLSSLEDLRSLEDLNSLEDLRSLEDLKSLEDLSCQEDSDPRSSSRDDHPVQIRSYDLTDEVTERSPLLDQMLSNYVTGSRPGVEGNLDFINKFFAGAKPGQTQTLSQPPDWWTEHARKTLAQVNQDDPES